MNKLLGNPLMLKEAKEGKPGHSWFVELLIFVLIFLIGERLAAIPVTVATVIWMLTGSESINSAEDPYSLFFHMQEFLSSLPEWLLIVSLFATALMTAAAIFYVTKVERRSTASMGFRKNSFGKEYVIGAAVGLVMITAALVISMLTGAIVVTPLNLAKPMIGSLLIWLAGYMIQGMSEEVVTRGYLMVSMTRKSPLWLSLLLSSVVFALLHLGNNGIGPLPFLNLLLSGLVFGVYTVKRGNLWGACAMHTFWNFYQGCIYGVSVSGTGTVDSALFSAVNVEGMDLWNGGAFGIEGSLSVTIVEVLTLLILLFVVPVAKKEQVPVTGPVEGTFTEVPVEPAEEPASASVSEPVTEPAPEPAPAEERPEAGAPHTDSF